jgi:hypothetical protein
MCSKGVHARMRERAPEYRKQPQGDTTPQRNPLTVKRFVSSSL